MSDASPTGLTVVDEVEGGGRTLIFTSRLFMAANTTLQLSLLFAFLYLRANNFGGMWHPSGIGTPPQVLALISLALPADHARRAVGGVERSQQGTRVERGHRACSGWRCWRRCSRVPSASCSCISSTGSSTAPGRTQRSRRSGTPCCLASSSWSVCGCSASSWGTCVELTASARRTPGQSWISGRTSPACRIAVYLLVQYVK